MDNKQGMQSKNWKAKALIIAQLVSVYFAVVDLAQQEGKAQVSGRAHTLNADGPRLKPRHGHP